MVVGSLEVAEANPGPDSWAVVATMGHYDEDALEAALAHRDVDVSLIASARRTDAVRKALMDRGLDETTLGRIRTSAGKVRGGSQEEIAVLALAEVVTARAKRRPAAKGVPVPAVVFATDPVCGMTVDRQTPHTSVHDGATAYFCSAHCKKRFDDDPQQRLGEREAVPLAHAGEHAHHH